MDYIILLVMYRTVWPAFASLLAYFFPLIFLDPVPYQDREERDLDEKAENRYHEEGLRLRCFFALMANVCVATLVRVRCRTTALGRTMSPTAYTLGLAAQTPCLDDL